MLSWGAGAGNNTVPRFSFLSLSQGSSDPKKLLPVTQTAWLETAHSTAGLLLPASRTGAEGVKQDANSDRSPSLSTSCCWLGDLHPPVSHPMHAGVQLQATLHTAHSGQHLVLPAAKHRLTRLERSWLRVVQLGLYPASVTVSLKLQIIASIPNLDPLSVNWRCWYPPHRSYWWNNVHDISVRCSPLNGLQFP